MLDKLTGKSVHSTIHLIACLGIAAGLPWSKIPLSLGTLLLGVNLLLKADFKQYWESWRGNKWFIALFIYIGFEWLSLLWSSDIHYALLDLKIKLPLYAIPIVLVAFPFERVKQLYLIALFFLVSLFITSFINIGSYQHWWGNHTYDDIRGLSLFGSHVRYSLLIVFGVVLCTGWILRKLPYRAFAYLLIVWFLYYTNYSQIIAGYLSLAAVLLLGVLLVIKEIKQPFIRRGIYFVFFSSMAGIIVWLYIFFQPIPHQISLDKLPVKTVNGNPYMNDSGAMRWENGYPVIALICEKELAPAWNKRSSINYENGTDIKGQHIRFTLWRYMASMGVTKDSLGISKLSRTDIEHVEHGIASIQLAQNGFKARLYGIKSQLEYPEDPNGHSLLQRIEYWRTSMHLIQNHLFFGAGAGDVDAVFKKHYTTSKTRLTAENQLRAHNQYLTSWISSGIFGFLAFLGWWMMQFIAAWKKLAFEWLCFIGICLSSFLTEDTLETQMGVTFVAFFFALFCTNSSLLYSKRIK